MIDIQNDFCEGGSLAVPNADTIIPLANQLQLYFDHVIATQDWHPFDHVNYAIHHPGHQAGDILLINGIQQILWPKHCEQYSKGAEFHPLLRTQNIRQVFQKGTDRDIDSYSAFYDNGHVKSTGLFEYLSSQHITDIYLIGLATDYCVKYSALDAVKLGFNVYVIEDACKGIDLHFGDIAEALREMKAAGVQLITSGTIMS